MTEPLIAAVSDTARWIAAVRATETMRANAVFADPLAEELAGYRGATIGARLPWLARALTEGGIIARTMLIDNLIKQSIADGCQRVVNLAAGFDTRPYRLDVPSDLEWIEVDLPDLISEKVALTKSHTPRCDLERIGLDLSDEPARSNLIRSFGESAKPTLAITEGLLAYLTSLQVRALSNDLARHPINWWITDVYSKNAMRTLKFSVNGHLDKSPVSFYAPRNGLAYLTDNGGWRPIELASELETAKRIGRLPVVLRPLARPIGGRPRVSGTGNWIAITRLVRPQ